MIGLRELAENPIVRRDAFNRSAANSNTVHVVRTRLNATYPEMETACISYVEFNPKHALSTKVVVRNSSAGLYYSKTGCKFDTADIKKAKQFSKDDPALQEKDCWVTDLACFYQIEFVEVQP